MKIIFLDIDGVLVTRNSVKYQHLYLPDEDEIQFSKRAVKNLNKLIRKTDAKIVISSTWRLFFSIEELQQKFKEQKITGEIISTTTVEKASLEEDIPRGQKITDWLEQHNDIELYVIIDDDIQADIIQFHPDNCVETSYKRGFADEERLTEALSILSKYT